MDATILQRILEGSSEPIIIQTEKKFAFLNPAACRLFEIASPGELAGKNIKDSLHPSFYELARQSIRMPPFDPVEYKMITSQGREVWVESRSEPVTYQGKKGALVFLRDITHRKETETALKDNEERMRFALEASQIGVWEINYTSQEIKSSLIHDQIFGYTQLPKDWSYEVFLSHVHPEDRTIVDDQYKNAYNTGIDWNLECRIFRVDGQMRWVWISGRTTTDEKGQFHLMIGVVQDITERKKAQSDLQYNYTMLRLAGELSQFGAWSYNVLENKVFWSDAVAEIHDRTKGYSPSVEEGLNYYTTESRELITQVFNRCIKEGVPYDVEAEIITPKGNRKWIRTLGEAVKEEGVIVKVQGAFQDITKAKNAGKELEESEEKFRSLFHNHLAVKLIIDAETGNIFDANKAAAHYYGWTIEELRKMHISQINTMTPEEIDKELVANRNSANVHFQFKHRKASGEVRDVEVFTSKVVMNGHDYMHSIIHDVTEKNLAEKQLKLLSRSVEQSPVSIMITDSQGLIEYVNPDFESTTGYTLQEIKGKPPRFLKSGYQSKELYHQLWTTILRGREWQGELINKKKNGHIYWDKIAISPIMDAAGEITNFVSVREDITERKIMMEDLMVAKEKAEESDRLKTAFLANISHEIRTPMNGILGFARILKEPMLSEDEQLRYIDIIEKSGQRMLDTLNDLIDISKIETGQVRIHTQNTHVSRRLKNLYDFFLPQTTEKGLMLLLSDRLPSASAFIKTDQGKLDSILSNLIKNAIKFTYLGEIEVGCNLKGNFLEFFVRDTGIGISHENQEIIFNRFEQAGNGERNVYQGSGLGLAISKAYVELLGGKIWVESRPGEGSVFFFTLPITESKLHLLKEPVNTFNRPFGVPNLSGKKILLAEDDLYSREIISFLLRKTGAAFVVAQDGQEAIDLFGRVNFNLVLLDIRLPKLNGYEVFKKIRLKNPTIPIVAQTAFVMVEDLKRMRISEFDDYLTKPIDPDALYEVLSSFLFKDQHIKS